MPEQLTGSDTPSQYEFRSTSASEQERINRRAFLNRTLHFSNGVLVSGLVVNMFSELTGPSRSIFTDLNKLDDITRERVIVKRNGRLLGTALAVAGAIGGILSSR